MSSLDACLLEPFEEPQTQEMADPESDPARIVLERLGEEWLQEAMMALPENYRNVMLLSAVEDRSYPEIARMMRTPIGTVRSRKYRAREMLRRRIEVVHGSECAFRSASLREEEPLSSEMS